MRNNHQLKPHCVICDDIYSAKRANAGYHICMPCGDAQARASIRTIVPMHKSNYMLITDLDDLKGINNKGGLHR
jgi:ribosomal protein L37AE/L43A